MTAIKVTTMDTELEFSISPKTRGRELFQHISRNLGLREVWYFGLMFKGANNEDIWFDCSRKTVHAIGVNARKLKFRVKYYPEDVSQELIEETTVYYFYLQVRSAILSDQIYCPPETSVLLASYAAQARHGDYDAAIHQNGFFKKERLLPERVFQQHSMNREAWENSIMKMWQTHVGMLTEEAMMEYLKLSQNLEMFGITYFNIYNKKRTELLLGVDALGLNIYKKEDKLNPIISFPWSEIENINFKGIKFTIKPTDRQAKQFIFYADDALVNKHILNLSIGNNSLYIKRRKKDSLEVQQMKVKAAEQRKFKLEQRGKLLHETLAREQAEKRENQYQMEIQLLKEEVERKQTRLLEAQLTIQKLQEQLRELQLAKEQFEKEQKELRRMMEQLERSKDLEQTERRKLEDEIMLKQIEVQKIEDEVRLRDEEARLLQEKIDEAKRREDEYRMQQEAARIQQEREKELASVTDKADDTLPSLVDINEKLKKDVELLQQQLEKTRLENAETEMDRIHRENIRKGNNKYKTLNEIRKGNTTRRVDMFENM
ncbi:hypothetical protein RN001_004619 [Aquatica leii]|uniref:FERM domain-containing protein n=1 Tax=Aquatica leii TaxID=1421715 RepID=A0AAN7Q5Z0_9COLE|nr:hypothetical protein RN001_004619 [Aquatica leii]